jgi:sensor histidine kinase regulating citrate/malate metabolism
MNANDVISEIHRVREKQAEECGFDPKRIGERMRDRQRERAARGVRYASFAQGRGAETGSSVLREE